jgi:hypothetical protein
VCEVKGREAVQQLKLPLRTKQKMDRRVVLPHVVHEVNRPFKRDGEAVGSEERKSSSPKGSKEDNTRAPTSARVVPATSFSSSSYSDQGSNNIDFTSRESRTRHEEPSGAHRGAIGLSPRRTRASAKPPTTPHAWRDSDLFSLRPEDETTTFQYSRRQAPGNAGRYVRPGRTLKFFGKESTTTMIHATGNNKSSTVAADDWDAGKQILNLLRTGEDAISFFAKEGARSAVKFIYLVKSDTGSEFRPYDLSVVPGNQIPTSGPGAATHFVMTEKGLTRMTRNAETGAVVPSEGWLFFVTFLGSLFCS